MADKITVYKSNIRILYSDLEKAINNYIEYGHTSGEFEFINAYLMAVLGAIVSYFDTVLKANGNKETEEIKACKYANNMLKHDPTIISHIVPKGGIKFPMTFPMEIEQIDIVWKWQDLNAYHEDQKEAYRSLFAEKPVLETLGKVLVQINV